jgi:RNA polymerase primary sigma factor
MAAIPARRKARSSDEGSLDHYLRDISVYPLITREQEAALAVRIRAGEAEALDALVRSTCASW